MDLDEILAKKPGDPLTELVKQDLERLSVDELHERVAILERELSRTKQNIQRAVNHRASANDIFKT
ncbi:DUF1192 domain-containing protein [Sphingomonas immobilis]|uniref:DUF1192 domain-containing protein n=1 Tax=Sphingomonas immobilis TaxID=3063997 RepID=A0ABT8ZY80_9SPHN|nr:DUF1192 domain-containing protein [Sphingomonas sp. CA1-15]MDO7842533.1 DUF1192 domain-containing protein [Sphingomonas sp. CA1-15]